jgi:uncharacterized phage protein gp47/JayE
VEGALVSLAVPTTQDISDTIIAQLEASLSQSIPLLPKAFARVLAKAIAGVFILVYKYAGFSFLQLFVAHATMQETVVNGKRVRPLVDWGRLFGVGDPLDATRAELVVAVTVTTLSGSLKAGTQLLRSETGVVYTTTAVKELNATTVQVNIRAASDQQGNGGAGAIGNLQPGDKVSFANPPSNVASDAVVVSTVTAGADAESPDSYRARIFRRTQARPQGGAYADYRQWAEEVGGIARAYPYTGDPGEVDVFCEATEASSGSPDGIPTQSQLDAVLASIRFDANGISTRRPANAAINVLPITRTAIDVVVTGLTPDTTATRDAIVEGMDEFLRTREPFIEGLSTLPRLDRITAATLGSIAEGIASAEGASVTSVQSTPGPSYTLGHGELAKLGTVTWT